MNESIVGIETKVFIDQSKAISKEEGATSKTPPENHSPRKSKIQDLIKKHFPSSEAKTKHDSPEYHYFPSTAKSLSPSRRVLEFIPKSDITSKSVGIINLSFKAQFEIIQFLYDDLSQDEQKSINDFYTKTVERSYVNSDVHFTTTLMPPPTLVMGEIIYFLEINPLKLIEILKIKQLETSTQKLHEEFLNFMEDIKQKISDKFMRHEKFPIQDSKNVLSMAVPIELAKILIIKNQDINIGLIPLLKNFFFLKESEMYPYEFDIDFVLRQLTESERLRSKLKSIRKPSSIYDPANQIIRITLGMSPLEEITSSSATKVVFAGLLSHLRQGIEGSCFATFLAIEILKSRLELCLEDFKQLIETSKITRWVDGHLVDFPFLLQMGEEALEKKLKIDHQGNVFVNNLIVGFLWEMPGLQVAFKVIGLEDLTTLTYRVLERLSTNEKIIFPQIFSVKEILKYFILYFCEVHSIANSKNLFETASFAFESQTQNPLQQAWENVIAGMAEATESSLLREAMIRSFVSTIESELKTILSEASVIIVVKKFSSILINRTTYEYDPTIKSTAIYEDGQSFQGGFILLDKGLSESSQDWKSIDSLDSFKDFARAIFDEAIISSNLQKISHDKVVKHINHFLESDKFYRSLLEKYHPDNKQDLDNNIPYDQFIHAPWHDQTGNNPFQVMRIYLELKYPIATTTIQITNAQELLTELIKLSRSHSPILKQQLLLKPTNLAPLRNIGTHTFSMMLGHPTFIPSWNQNISARHWISENLVKPGLAVSNQTITSFTKEKIINLVCEKLLPDNLADKFKKKLSKFNFVSVKEFRCGVIATLIKLFAIDAQRLNHFERLLDTNLVQNYLPLEERQKLLSSVVHFADSNWGKNLFDIHFCFVVNPGNGKLEIWKIFNDGSGLAPLDQLNWISKSRWEYPTIDNFII